MNLPKPKDGWEVLCREPNNFCPKNLKLVPRKFSTYHRSGNKNKDEPKGVSKAKNKFVARIKFGDNPQIRIGTYDNASTAALEYDVAALCLFGAFANTHLSIEELLLKGFNVDFSLEDPDPLNKIRSRCARYWNDTNIELPAMLRNQMVDEN